MGPVTVTIPNASVPIGRTSVKKPPTKERELASDVMLHASGLMIVTPDRCVLFLKRAAGHDHAGEWCFPGGAIEQGETAELAAIRECREETGHIIDEPIKEIDNEVSPEGVDFTTFVLRANNPFIPELDDEHVGWSWSPLDDPPQPLHPGVAGTLKRLIDTDEVEDIIGQDENFGMDQIRAKDAFPANVATPAELRSVIKFPPPKAPNAVREIDQSFARGGAGKELQQSTEARRFEQRGGLTDHDKGHGPLGKDRDVNFKESDHPRAPDGKFGSGGSSKSKSTEKEKAESEKGSSGKSTATKYKPGIHAAGLDPSNAKKKEWAASSPIKTVDDLLKDAPRYQKELSSVLGSIADKLGLAFHDPGVKSKGRIERKVNIDGKPPNKINDAVRGGVSINTPEQGDKIVDELSKRFEVADEGWYVTPAGYFDRKVMVRFDNGQVGEVQIWHPDLLRAKEKEGGHRLYVESQQYPVGDPRREELSMKMLELYSKITDQLRPEWKALLGRGGSASDENFLVNSAFDSVFASMPTEASSTSIHSPSRQTHASPGVHKAGSPSHEQNLISFVVSGMTRSSGLKSQYKAGENDFKRNGIANKNKVVIIPAVVRGPTRK